MRGGRFKKVSGGRLYQDIDAARAMLLKWAILFHDIGLPAMQSPNGGKNIHSSDHGWESALMARKICRRLRFSRRQTDHISVIIENQIQPFLLYRDQQKKIPFQKAFTRFFMKCRDLVPDILLHALSDCTGKKHADRSGPKAFSEFIRMLIHNYYSVLKPAASLPPLVTGKDLINEFGLKPSVRFKRILERVEEERLSRQVLTRPQAIKRVEELISRKNRTSSSQ